MLLYQFLKYNYFEDMTISNLNRSGIFIKCFWIKIMHLEIIEIREIILTLRMQCVCVEPLFKLIEHI